MLCTTCTHRRNQPGARGCAVGACQALLEAAKAVQSCASYQKRERQMITDTMTGRVRPKGA